MSENEAQAVSDLLQTINAARQSLDNLKLAINHPGSTTIRINANPFGAEGVVALPGDTPAGIDYMKAELIAGEEYMTGLQQQLAAYKLFDK